MPLQARLGLLLGVLVLGSATACSDDANTDSGLPTDAAPRDGGVVADGGSRDAGSSDAGSSDGPLVDSGLGLDGGETDAGGGDDGGVDDAGADDAGTNDAGTNDAGTNDAGTNDAGTNDAGMSDAGTNDAGTPDAGRPDAGPPDAGAPACTPPNAAMTFFVTENSNGASGGNLGGLSGADARCTAAAVAAGITGRTWRAYLSTTTVNARTRIGNGPWLNYDGASIGDLQAIHFENGGTGIPLALIKTECGRTIHDADVVAANQSRHDILTGSQTNGTLARALDTNGLPTGDPLTCNDWTSNAAAPYQAWVGHTDSDSNFQFWNSAHDTLGCTEAQFIQYNGSGGLYCFAL